MTEAVSSPPKKILNARKDVPRPFLQILGLGLLLLSTIVVFMGVEDDPELMPLAIVCATTGGPMFLFGCVVKAIRDEGTALRGHVEDVQY